MSGWIIAINNPERLTKLFAFAGNSDPSGVAVTPGSSRSSLTSLGSKRSTRSCHRRLTKYLGFRPSSRSPRCGTTQPNFTGKKLKAITVPTWIVHADHDEAIKRENTLFMAANIPDAGLLLQPEVSHFSFLQDPGQFTSDVLHFLEHVKSR